jgi:hypothetical protein
MSMAALALDPLNINAERERVGFQQSTVRNIP